MERYVMIGAGSAAFTRGLLADLIAAGQPAEVRLVDINATALQTAYGLARKMLAQTGAPLTVSAHTDRRDALPGATVVICTVGVGGRRAWEQDVFIPRKYGIYVPVGDTVGPGGSARAVRMIPASSLSVVGILLQYFGEKFGRRSERLVNLPWNYIRSALILGIGLIYPVRLWTESPV